MIYDITTGGRSIDSQPLSYTRRYLLASRLATLFLQPQSYSPRTAYLDIVSSLAQPCHCPTTPRHKPQHPARPDELSGSSSLFNTARPLGREHVLLKETKTGTILSCAPTTSASQQLYSLVTKLSKSHEYPQNGNSSQRLCQRASCGTAPQRRSPPRTHHPHPSRRLLTPLQRPPQPALPNLPRRPRSPPLLPLPNTHPANPHRLRKTILPLPTHLALRDRLSRLPIGLRALPLRRPLSRPRPAGVPVLASPVLCSDAGAVSFS